MYSQVIVYGAVPPEGIAVNTKGLLTLGVLDKVPPNVAQGEAMLNWLLTGVAQTSSHTCSVKTELKQDSLANVNVNSTVVPGDTVPELGFTATQLLPELSV